MSLNATSGAAAPGGSAFPTTHWSVVLQAGARSESQVRSALESLCQRYWYPLYAFIRRQGRAHHEAEDCTQEFLARLLANGGMATARPERGRFRTFLLTALRNFLTNEWQRAHARKRGGGQPVVSLDWQDAQQRFSHEPADPGLTPEQVFDLNWARGLIQRALITLSIEYEKRGKAALFIELASLVWGHVASETLATPAERVGLNSHAFTVALQRLRQRLAQRLRTDVAETVASDTEVDEELRHLIAAASAGTSTR